MYARGGYDVSFTVCSWPLFHQVFSAWNPTQYRGVALSQQTGIIVRKLTKGEPSRRKFRTSTSASSRRSTARRIRRMADRSTPGAGPVASRGQEEEEVEEAQLFAGIGFLGHYRAEYLEISYDIRYTISQYESRRDETRRDETRRIRVVLGWTLARWKKKQVLCRLALAGAGQSDA